MQLPPLPMEPTSAISDNSKALDYTCTVNTSPIPRPSAENKCSALCPSVTHPHGDKPKMS